MVKGFWLNRSHGIVAGEPKSFKSTLAMDMCVSIATGKPFMGVHEVVHQGPVIYIQNENSKWIMKDRLGKMASSKGIVGSVEHVSDRNLKLSWAPDMPIYMVNQQGFLISDPLHQEQMEKMIVKYKAALVVLDPLYLMFDGDINSAKELSPVLQWLLDIRYRLDCGVMLIHHYNKGSGSDTRRGGQRMLGSTTLHGWTESAWYIRNDAPDEEDADMPEEDINSEKIEAIVTMEREFRGAGLYPKADIGITMGPIGSFDYGVEAHSHVKKKTVDGKAQPADPEVCKRAVIQLIRSNPKGLSDDAISRLSGFGKTEIKKAVDMLADAGMVKRVNDMVVMRND
jgi:hypothetical protein